MPGLLYADDLVLCGELEEDLWGMEGQFIGVCSRRGLKVNAGLGCEVCVDRIYLDNVSDFKYLGCVLNKSHRDEAQCSREEGSRWY